MDFDFPLIPLLPQPITLVPAATFVALENSQNQAQQVFASSVSIGLSKGSSVSSNGTNSISSSYASSCTSASSLLSDQERLGVVIDALGQASAKAQDLPTSITQTQRLAQNPTQRVYVVRTRLDGGEDHWLDQLKIGSPLMEESIRKSRLELNGTSTMCTSLSTQEESKNGTRARSEEKGVYVAGMLKMGEKKLFIVDKSGTMHEQEACCVLDFYVDESCQRQGFGKLLFDYMLKVEEMDPTQIAYDRPSPKLFGFLNKHFHLSRHLPQPNLFAIFEGFKLLDCGQVIQVDDNALSPAGRSLTHASSLIPTGSSFTDSTNTGNIHGTKPVLINRALQSSLVFGSGPEPSSPGTKPVVVNRALQSSLVFRSGVELDSTGTSSSGLSGQRPQPPQPVKRVSSAFSSSFSFSNATPTTPRTGTATSAGISRLLASSIVFADPITTD